MQHWLVVRKLSKPLITTAILTSVTLGLANSNSPPITTVNAADIIKQLYFPIDTEVGFKQTSMNPLLKNITQQQGVMFRSDADGLVMRVSTPRMEERTLHNGTMTIKYRKRGPQKSGSSMVTRRVKLDENRPSHLALLALEALLNRNVATLETHFLLSATLAAGGWQIKMQPRAAAVQDQLTQLLFYGTDQHLKRFRSERRDKEGVLSHWLDIEIAPPS